MGYFKTRCLMAFKDHNSLKENGVLKVKKNDYLENSLAIEENVAKSKTSHIIVIYTLLFISMYLLYWGGYGIARLLNVSNSDIYREINYWFVKIVYVFLFVYVISYINVDIRRSNLLRIIGLPLIVYFAYMAIMLFKLAGVMGDFN